MTRSERITTPVYIPCLLAVGCSPGVLGRCEAAAARLGLVVKACCLDTAGDAAMARQPLLVVTQSSVHTLHADEVEAIARVAGALLVKVDRDVSERELGAMFEGALRLRLGSRDRRSDAGLYSLIGSVTAEVPLPPPSEKPRPSDDDDGPITVRATPRSLRAGSLPPRPMTSVPPVSGERPRVTCDRDGLFAGSHTPSPRQQAR